MCTYVYNLCGIMVLLSAMQQQCYLCNIIQCKHNLNKYYTSNAFVQLYVSVTMLNAPQ